MLWSTVRLAYTHLRRQNAKHPLASSCHAYKPKDRQGAIPPSLILLTLSHPHISFRRLHPGTLRRSTSPVHNRSQSEKMGRTEESRLTI